MLWCLSFWWWAFRKKCVGLIIFLEVLDRLFSGYYLFVLCFFECCLNLSNDITVDPQYAIVWRLISNMDMQKNLRILQYCSVKIASSFYLSKFYFRIWFVNFGRIQKHIGIKKKRFKSESIIFCFKLLLIVSAVLFIKLIYQYMY